MSSLFCTIGILAALNIRERTGRGQLVDVSLVDSVYAALENIPQKFFVEGEIPGRIGNRYEFIYPYNTFKAMDGWVVLGIANEAIWGRFLEAANLEYLRDDERFSSNKTRVENHATLRPLIEGWTGGLRKDEIVTLLNMNRVPSCPIYDVREASEDPHISVAREMVVEVEQPGLGKVRLQGNPVKMSETEPRPKGPAPELGGDTEDVLRELLGYDEETVEGLRARGVI